MTKVPDKGASPEWRNASGHDHLLRLEPTGWAWEFLRRNPRYIDTVTRLAPCRRDRLPHNPRFQVIHTAHDPGVAAAWGLLFAENPALPYCKAAVFWRPAANPGVLPAIAIAASSGEPDAFDVSALKCRVCVLRRGGGGEQLLLSNGFHSIQIDLLSGSALDGSVRLEYQLGGFDTLEAKLMTLHRLATLLQTGVIPNGARSSCPRSKRWRLALKALDLANGGSSQRQIAETLFGVQHTRSHWRLSSDYLRDRVRRLIRLGQSLSSGGYIRLLKF